MKTTMATKLTLRLDASAIHRAKRYAQQHHLSLSRMVEGYFLTVGSRRPLAESLTPLVRELSGIAPTKSARQWKEAYAEYLTKKYAA